MGCKTLTQSINQLVAKLLYTASDRMLRLTGCWFAGTGIGELT